MPRAIETRRGSGILLAQALSLAFFAACLGWVAREVEFVVANDRITSSLSLQRALDATLGRQLAAFGAAALLVHVAFGFAVYGLARLTESACPRIGARRPALIAFWFALLAGLAMAANTVLFPASVFAGEESGWRGSFAGIPRVALAGPAAGCRRGGLRSERGVPLALTPAVVATRTWMTVAAAAAAILAAILGPRIPASPGPAEPSAPNIVILGIDSLRNDLTIPRRGDARIPHIRAFLVIGAGSRIRPPRSPAPSAGGWRILTGRDPVTTNARYNLMPAS